MEMIKINNFSKKYENVSVYQNFNLEIEEGKLP
jgi:ABC-type sugar transport system ATPase subunit